MPTPACGVSCPRRRCKQSCLRSRRIGRGQGREGIRYHRCRGVRVCVSVSVCVSVCVEVSEEYEWILAMCLV